MQRLHVTNGDAAGERIGPLVAPEPVLPWRDMLHEGPVPADLDDLTLAERRAAYLAGRYRLEPAATLERFRERDRTLARAVEHGNALLLWFEHDLYDQLQLVQVLSRLAGADLPEGQVRLAQADHGLSELDPVALARLQAEAAPVSPAQLDLAHRTWAAFRAPTPEGLARLLETGTTALPWLGPALERLLEELPSGYPGLSRTERQMLDLLEAGPLPAGELYTRARALEEPWFMGDWPFFAVLDELAAAPLPLVEGMPAGGFPFEGGEATRRAYLEAEIRVTHDGRLVREGRLDRAVVKPLDRWLGGTHLTNAQVWRWEPATRLLERDEEPPG